MGAVAPDGSWTGVAELTWQLRGFDEQPARSDVVVRFVPDGDGLGIAGFERRPAHRRLACRCGCAVGCPWRDRTTCW